MGIREYRTGDSAELMTASLGVALIEVTGRYFYFADFALFVPAFAGGFVGLKRRYFVRSALEATNALGPAGSGHVVETLLLGPEFTLNFYQAQSVASHELSISEL